MKVWVLAKEENFKVYENKRFLEAAKAMDIECYLVDPKDFELIITEKGEKSIWHKGQNVTLPDALIPRMGSGSTYFGLSIIRRLERLGVLVTNDSTSIEIAKDKLETIQLLAANNVPIPKTMFAKFPLDYDIVEKNFSYPMILKPVSGSYGKGVFLVKDRQQIEDLAQLVEVFKDPKVNIIIQDYIKESHGVDIRVLVVGGRTIGAMKRTAKEGSFKANFSNGAEVSKTDCNQILQWLSVECSRLLDLDVAGVDLLIEGGSYKICEINSSPGFEGFEKATGVKVPEEIFKFIQFKLS